MSNPLAQQVMAMLQARAGGAPPGGAPAAAAAPPGPMAALAGLGGGAPGGGGGGSPDDGGNYASMLSDLRGADPGMLVRQLRRIQQLMAVMTVHYLPSLPNVAGQLSKMVPNFDKVIKEAEKGANVNATVRSPIQMGAAGPSPQNGSPSPAGPSVMPMAA